MILSAMFLLEFDMHVCVVVVVVERGNGEEGRGRHMVSVSGLSNPSFV